MAGEVHEMNEMAFDDMRKAVLEECRRTERLADALLQDDRQHRLVPDLVRNIKNRIEWIEKTCSEKKYELCFCGEGCCNQDK